MQIVILWLSRVPQARQGRGLRLVVATSYLQILQTGTGRCIRPLRQMYPSIVMRKTKQCRMRLNDQDHDYDPEVDDYLSLPITT